MTLPKMLFFEFMIAELAARVVLLAVFDITQ